jgi:amino-acid N-acetyltransferase
MPERGDDPVSDVTIETAMAGELDQVSALLEASDLGAWRPDEQDAELLVARDREGRVVGCGALVFHGDLGLLRSVAVAAERRGSGLGQAIVETLLELPRARGLAGIYLLTTTAAGFFARLAFVPVEREEVPAAIRSTQQYRTECPASAVVMRRAAAI